MKPIRSFYTIVTLIICQFLFAGYSHAADSSGSNFRLPQEAPPVLGCWFWLEREFEAEGCQDFLDLVNEHSLYNMLTTSVRAPLKQVTDKEVHDQIQGCKISLNPPLDLALWRDAAGEFHGAVQNLRGPNPPSLQRITNDWVILDLPSPPVD
ncbi:MAG: hypothetical protein ACP5I1_11845 [Candidatus Hinthialibacter sp.]